ncbi:MAG TPA: DUF3467 domain-containing protein [Candidatus Nanoarchaeia archaeon]|nr:DUF3467 domain-containing protein [Candidatus Nanoarchaeia archaeon]
MEQKQIQAVNNPDKNVFASNEQVVHHLPDKILIDFKNVYPQFVAGTEPLLVINHRIILLDPHNAKDFLRVLKENIDKYEAKFGKIERPKEWAQAEKEFNKVQKQQSTISNVPSYMG